MSNKQQEVLTLIRREANQVEKDLQLLIEEAHANNNEDLATELQDAAFVFMRGTITFSRGNYLIKTTATLRNDNGIVGSNKTNLDVNAEQILDMYKNGSRANTKAGYFVNYPSGPLGVKYLLVHEIRHGTMQSIFGGSQTVLPERVREHDADAFIGRVYK